MNSFKIKGFGRMSPIITLTDKNIDVLPFTGYTDDLYKMADYMSLKEMLSLINVLLDRYRDRHILTSIGLHSRDPGFNYIRWKFGKLHGVGDPESYLKMVSNSHFNPDYIKGKYKNWTLNKFTFLWNRDIFSHWTDFELPDFIDPYHPSKDEVINLFSDLESKFIDQPDNFYEGGKSYWISSYNPGLNRVLVMNPGKVKRLVLTNDIDIYRNKGRVKMESVRHHFDKLKEYYINYGK